MGSFKEFAVSLAFLAVTGAMGGIALARWYEWMVIVG
ncbi:Uncharacterised protein [BD1-7 clade bacterium]|uniref:Uncharacterized protein n=1 Tax=BD1-7 clade bacterium TaxID=2029982 RepID=A0A5S9QR49_9GAMM|nr:Uncharacterised protein [BD1-7 clade bacterium]CAA0122097.1 Uncharacterised protein [BD1-7 clade bacterium]